MESCDVVVAGGGIAGAAVAYHLVAAGARVVLIDRHHPGRATDAGAGILCPETSGNPLDAWFELVMAAGDHYRDLIPALAEAGQTDTGYDRCGLLAVALADWDVSTFEAVAELALVRAARSGADIHPVSPADAARRFPPAAPITRALFNPQAARVDGRRLTTALLGAAVTGGLDIREASVEDVTMSNGRVTAVAGIDCGALVVAGGAWSPSIGDQLGISIPVRPERGQIIHLDVDDPSTGDWPILQPAFGFYMVTWPGGRVVVGATREPRAGFDARPTVAGLRQILDEVARVAPGLAEAVVADIRVGLRPISVDDLPILGPSAEVPNVYLATGYGANGLLLAPWCGHLVASAALGTIPSELAPFLPARFA